jgi:predicted TPR repeat methyltransferase
MRKTSDSLQRLHCYSRAAVTRDATLSPLPTLHESSTDLRADGRFTWARAAEQEGDLDAAADLYAQVLERVPEWAPAWFALGHVREQLGDRTGAAEAFRAAAAQDPTARLGAELRLAALGAAPPPPRASDAYVARLFDHYASRFEHHLVDTLGYRGPQLIRAAIDAIRPAAPARFSQAIDIGCGTGLMARAFAPRVEHFTGVDLAPAMIAAAQRTGLYQRLVLGEAVGFLAGEPAGRADLVLAADVLIYVGELPPLMAALAHALAPGGLFAATLQSTANGPWSLGNDLRYSHSQAYVEAASAASGLHLAHVDDVSFRNEGGVNVPGLVVVLSKA